MKPETWNLKLDNTQECFVQLWLRLERTRRLLAGQYKRFCIRRVLKTWFGGEADDDFIWDVCTRCDQMGLDELPPPNCCVPSSRSNWASATIALT